MYQRAGMKSAIHRNAAGMLSNGKIRPEKTSVGIISPTPEARSAAICESTSVEISKPNDYATMINTIDTTASHNRLPRTGTPITNTARRSIVTTLVTDSVK